MEKRFQKTSCRLSKSRIRGILITVSLHLKIIQVPSGDIKFKLYYRQSAFSLREVTYHIIFTAETHNFPSGVAPFPGAETGTGGRVRDVHATGKGSIVVAGTAAYCVGNLRIPDYPLPWE